jgi:hypothetical protein
MPTDMGTLTPEQMLQQQQILRQQKMAEMLMQQGMQQPQGQMISGHYVKPSIFQNLAGLANTYVGQRGIEKADQAQIDLAKAIRNQESVSLADYMADLQGKPAVPEKVTELAGPYMGNIPKPTATIAGQPAVEGNPMLANMNALQNPNSPAFLRQHAIKKITEGPNWAEVSQVNQKTGDTDTYVYDKNSADPKSTMRFVATSKPALTLDQRLSLQDKGIAIPNAGGNSVANGGNMPVAGNPAGSGQINPSLPAIKPVSATNVPQTDLVKAFGYDPFKPPPLPAGLPSPQDARAYRSDQFKPLEGEKAKKVNGAASYQDALDKYVQVINSVDLKDLANPQVRNRIDSAYNTAMLTGKNAFDLGVLNGGDERILNSLLPNYKDVSQLLVTKQTIKELAQAQKEYGTGVILKEYGSANKPVPEMYRKHIVVPKSVTPDVPAKKGGIPAGIDPAIWAVMTPQEKSLWQ